MPSYVVTTIRPWNIQAFHKHTPSLPGEWHLINDPAKLIIKSLDEISPRYIFFPHWSSVVPVEITDKFECVCFHMSDVPYGRGGSPLQNLIARGHTDTMLTALRMDQGLDTGPVYSKKPLSLKGSAQEIYERAAALSFDMIADMIETEPTPTIQSGNPTIFKRRLPEQSHITGNFNTNELYDHIRMLDADGYPRAFIDYGDWRLEFHHAEIDKPNNRITAQVIFHSEKIKKGSQ